MAERKGTKAIQLIKLFHYWCGRLKLPKPVEIRKDNRLDCPLAIDNWQDKNNVCLRYHSRRLGACPKCILISDIFHEIGHLINNLPYNTKKQQIESEYQAEKFSCDMMKKYYPKQYKLLIKRFIKLQRMKYYKKHEPIYYKAFIRIKDYKDTIV
jgi:hypothetical protein